MKAANIQRTQVVQYILAALLVGIWLAATFLDLPVPKAGLLEIIGLWLSPSAVTMLKAVGAMRDRSRTADPSRVDTRME